MRRTIILLSMLLLTIMTCGCSKAFWGGTASGVLGTGAGYEYKANRELDRIEEEYKQGILTQEEYEARKDQIRRMSITQ